MQILFHCDVNFETGSIKGCGNAKVVKTLVAMTTVLSASGLLFRRSSVAWLRQ